MSIFELKRVIENNIRNIKYNIDFYESLLLDEPDFLNELKSICDPKKMQEEINEWTTFLDKINNEIYTQCNHVFIHDYIDTYPERSQPIYYCKHCWLNQKQQ